MNFLDNIIQKRFNPQHKDLFQSWFCSLPLLNEGITHCLDNYSLVANFGTCEYKTPSLYFFKIIFGSHKFGDLCLFSVFLFNLAKHLSILLIFARKKAIMKYVPYALEKYVSQ
jgi:hypothetical protein